MGVLLRRERHAQARRLPDAEARRAGPELEARVLVGAQPQRVHIERARALGVLGGDAYEVEPADLHVASVSGRFRGRLSAAGEHDLRPGDIVPGAVLVADAQEGADGLEAERAVQA